MMCMSQSTNRSPSFMTSSSASRIRSVVVRGVESLEPAQQSRPRARALARARDGLVEDLLGYRDQLAARLRAYLDRARGLEVVHGHPGVGHRLADGQQPVISQDEGGLVTEVGDEPWLLVVVERGALEVVIAEAAQREHRVLGDRQQAAALGGDGDAIQRV